MGSRDEGTEFEIVFNFHELKCKNSHMWLAAPILAMQVQVTLNA